MRVDRPCARSIHHADRAVRFPLEPLTLSPIPHLPPSVDDLIADVAWEWMGIGHFIIASVQFGDAAKLDDRRTPLSS